MYVSYYFAWTLPSTPTPGVTWSGLIWPWPCVFQASLPTEHLQRFFSTNIIATYPILRSALSHTMLHVFFFAIFVQTRSKNSFFNYFLMAGRIFKLWKPAIGSLGFAARKWIVGGRKKNENRRLRFRFLWINWKTGEFENVIEGDYSFWLSMELLRMMQLAEVWFAVNWALIRGLMRGFR